MVTDNLDSEVRKHADKGQQTTHSPVIGHPRLVGGSIAEGTKDVGPDHHTFLLYDEMLRYPPITATTILITTPILGQIKQAEAESDDPAVAKFIHETFIERGVLFKTVQQALNSFWFGASFNELIWQVEELFLEAEDIDIDGNPETIIAWDGPAHTVKAVKEVNPSTVVEIIRRWTESEGKPADGSYDGFVQRASKGQTYTYNGQSKSGIYIPPTKSFVHTYNGRWDNMWGQSRLIPAVPFFSWAQDSLKSWMAWASQKLGPNRVGRFPQGTTLNEQGEPVSNGEIILETINAIDSQIAVALPAERDDNGEYLWDIQSDERQGDSPFKDHVDFLNGMAVLGIFVPERVYKEAQFGTRAEAEAHTDTFMMTLDVELDRILEGVNEYVVKRIVSVNFGPDSICKIRVPGLTSSQKQLIREAFIALVANPANSVNVDFRKLAENFGLPLAEEEEGLPDDELLDEGIEGDEFVEDENPIPDEDAGEDAESGNLILHNQTYVGDGFVSLADLSIYDITVDNNSVIGYKIVNKNTGRRVLGTAARNIIKSMQGASAKAAKAAEVAARKAQREAERKRKAAEAAAKREQAAKERAEKQKTRASQQALKKAEREAKAAEREAAKAERAAAAAAKKAEREKLKAQKEQERKEKEEAKAAEKLSAEQVSVVKAEVRELEQATSRLSENLARQAIEEAGYEVEGSVSEDRDAAVQQARDLASNDPDVVISVVKVKGGYMVVKKPKKNITRPDAGPSNVALASNVGYDSSVPTGDTRALWSEAENTIRDLLGGNEQ